MRHTTQPFPPENGKIIVETAASMLFKSNLLYRKNHDISLDSMVLFYNPLGFRAAKAYNGLSWMREA